MTYRKARKSTITSTVLNRRSEWILGRKKNGLGVNYSDSSLLLTTRDVSCLRVRYISDDSRGLFSVTGKLQKRHSIRKDIKSIWEFETNKRFNLTKQTNKQVILSWIYLFLCFGNIWDTKESFILNNSMEVLNLLLTQSISTQLMCANWQTHFLFLFPSHCIVIKRSLYEIS